jgi:hypothetical protein
VEVELRDIRRVFGNQYVKDSIEFPREGIVCGHRVQLRYWGHINIASRQPAPARQKNTFCRTGQVMCLSFWAGGPSSNFHRRTKNLVVEGDRHKDLQRQTKNNNKAAEIIGIIIHSFFSSPTHTSNPQ